MDRLQAIRLFIRVVDLGSFSKAAADYGVGQPAVTKMVGQIEKQLGVRLLYRSTHGVTPTEIGALYYEKCKIIAHHAEEADSLAVMFQSEVQGNMRVSTSVAFGRRVLFPLVIRFMKQNPKLHIDLSFEDRYQDLVEQGVDVAIRMGRLADSNLGARYLGVNPWVVIAAPEYLTKRGIPDSPQALHHHDALIYSTVQGDARWVFSGGDGVVQPIKVHGPLRTNNLSALLTASCEGMGLAALPWYVAYESISRGLVKPVLTDWMLPSQEIHAVFPSPQLLPVKVDRFIKWLQPQLGDAWWKDV